MSAGSRSAELIDLEPAPADLAAEAIRGLGSSPKTLPCKLFYDKRGSDLFEANADRELALDWLQSEGLIPRP